MKKSIIKTGLLAVLFLGSFGSFFYLNSPSVRQQFRGTLEKPIQQAADPDEEKGELVLPDVTVIQKAMDLVEKLMSK